MIRARIHFYYVPSEVEGLYAAEPVPVCLSKGYPCIFAYHHEKVGGYIPKGCAAGRDGDVCFCDLRFRCKIASSHLDIPLTNPYLYTHL